MININLTPTQIIKLFQDKEITLDNLDEINKKKFISSSANELLKNSSENKDFIQLENLFENKEIKNTFVKEVDLIVKSAELSYLDNLPEDSFVNFFVYDMTIQNFKFKKDFYEKITPLIIENSELMEKFFKIRLRMKNKQVVTFDPCQPLGLHFLRVVDNKEHLEQLFEKNILSPDLFNMNSKKTMAHCMSQYSFEANKVILDNISNLSIALKDKCIESKTPLDLLSANMREHNINTLEHIFLNKIEIKEFKKDFFNCIVRYSKFLSNENNSDTLKNKILNSLTNILNSDQIQSDNVLKEEVAKVIGTQCSNEIHYLWLNAKLKLVDNNFKKSKI